MKYLHRHRFVHGDIKAENVLISSDGGALLCDLGLARFKELQTSVAQKGAGSTRWQSPEVMKGESKSFESDVYAFGMTIYEVTARCMEHHPLRLTLVQQVLAREVPFAHYPLSLILLMH